LPVWKIEKPGKMLVGRPVVLSDSVVVGCVPTTCG
jgi:hypothetical protein